MFDSDTLSLVASRADFIKKLADEPLEKREMVDALGYSRATVNRAIGDLEDAELVCDTPEGYEPTLTATLAVEKYQRFLEVESDILDTTELFSPLPHQVDVAPSLLVNAELTPAGESEAYRNLGRVRSRLDEVDQVGVLLPSSRALPALGHWRDVLAADRREVRITLDSGLHDAMDSDDQLLPRLAVKDCCIQAADTPPFVLVTASDEQTQTVFMLVYDRDEGGFGLLRNDSEAACAWAQSAIADVEADAVRVDDEMAAAYDEAKDPAAGDTLQSATGLPFALEAEGFVSISEQYFDVHEPRNLPAALRTGLTIADVHEGHAIDRHPVDEADSESLSEQLLRRLRTGTDCALVGQPGSGKSTVCKAVACEWFRSNRGSVLYRESGKSNPFESVAALRSHLRSTDGETLVVVEDAMRREANSVFQLVEEFGSWEGVHFLVDSRESEWGDTRSLPVDAAVREYKERQMEVITITAPDAGDCDRFLQQFEQVTGSTIATTSEEIARSLEDEAAASGGMFLLAHRVSVRAAPVVSSESVTPTRLVEDVQQRIVALTDRDSELVVQTALLSQFLNVTGTPVFPEFIYAQTLGSSADDADAVIEGLIELQLLDGADGTEAFRTSHEVWSRLFLTEALEMVEDAPRLLGTALTTVFKLAGDETTRSKVADGYGATTRLLRRIEADPAEWSDEFATQIFELGQEVPALAPYYGRFDDPTFDLGVACSTEAAYRCGYFRGKTLARSGELDAAIDEYRTVKADIEERDDAARFETQLAHCLGGVGSALRRKGEFDDSKAYTRRALELHRDNDNSRGEADCLVSLSQIAFRRSEYEESNEYDREALSIYEELGDLKRQSNCLGNMAVSFISVDDYDATEEYAERSLEIRREIGFDLGMAQCHNLLGRVAEGRGNYDQALDQHRQTLAIATKIGNDEWQVVALINLGNTCIGVGRLEEAEEYLERALEANREMDDPKDDAITRRNLAEVARRMGNFEAAHEHASTGLESAEQIENDRIGALCRAVLGKLALEEGEHEVARRRLTSALETFSDLGIENSEVSTLVALGRVELDAGNIEQAEEHAQAARELVDSLESSDRSYEGLALCLAGKVHDTQGDAKAARASFEEAVSLTTEVSDSYIEALILVEAGCFEAAADGDVAVDSLEAGRALASEIGANQIEERAKEGLSQIPN